MKIQFNGYTIRNSGKNFLKIIDQKGESFGSRVKTVEAAKALIFSHGRVMTRKEWGLVYDCITANDSADMLGEPTTAQRQSELLVRAGVIEGYA